MIKPSFNEEAATQVACQFIMLAGGKINYTILIKLMYLTDRSALVRFGRPITFDDYVSMEYGPVLSRTLNLIKEVELPWIRYWRTYISRPSYYSVSLKDGDVPDDLLSEADLALIREVFANFGSYSLGPLVKHLHECLPEWTDPGKSSLPITYEAILDAEGLEDSEINLIAEDLAHLRLVDVASA